MTLHVAIKQQFFLHFIFAVSRSQSIAEILPLPRLENKRTPYGKHPVSILNLLSSSSCNSARTNLILSELDNHWESYDVVYIFQDGDHTVANIPLLSGLWHLASMKAKNYLRIKFRPDISIHGQYIATSGIWKQTAAIWKFYFGFRFWPFYCHRRTKFHQNRIIRGRVMTS